MIKVKLLFRYFIALFIFHIYFDELDLSEDFIELGLVDVLIVARRLAFILEGSLDPATFYEV